MSVTNSVIVNFFARRIIGAIDLKDRFLEPVFTSIKRHTKGLLTGPSPNDDSGAWLESVTITDGANANDITLGNLYGVDGSGEYLSLDSGDNDITDVPFENALGVTFYVAARSEAVPVDVGFDVAAGIIKYDRHQRRIGHLEEPTAVIVSGGGLEFTIGNHLLDASDDFTSRTAIVYLKNPVATSAVTAIETVVVSSGDKVVTVAQFGQVSPSLTASDYEIVITGPAITRHAAIETTPPWAFIGTVVGGTVPRTYSVADQISILPLADVQDNFDELIDRGWITNPSLTYAATTVTVAGAGVAYYKGRLIDTPTSGALTPGNSFSGFLYLDAADNTWKLTAVWATAFSGSCVPYQHIVTNSGGTIIGRGAALGLVKKFNKTLRITVSSDTNYPGAFSSLRDALAAVAGARLYTTSIPAALIEVVGKISETSVINLDAIPLKYVRIVGRSLSMYPGSDAGEHSMARISWNFNGGLFTAATAVPISASFENIWFQPEAVGTVSADSIFNISSTAQVQGLRFEKCGFDMKNTYNATSGRAAHVIYSTGSVALGELSFDRCKIFTTDAVVYSTVARFNDLKVLNCTIDNGSTSPGLVSKGGGFWSESASASEKVMVKGNWYDGLGTFLKLTAGVSDIVLSENTLSASSNAVDEPLLVIGACTYLRMHDNYLRRNSTGTPNTAVVTIAGPSTASLVGIFVHNNYISSETTGTSGKGVVIDGVAASGLCRGLHFSNNLINGVHTGLVVQNGWVAANISGNYIEATTVGISLDGSVTPVTKSVVSGNTIRVNSSGDAILATGAGGADNIVFGNQCQINANGNLSIAANDQIVFGNYAGDVTLAEDVILLGNRAVGVTTDSDSIVTGNNFSGTFACNQGSVASSNILTGTLDLVGSNIVVSASFVETIDFTGSANNVISGCFFEIKNGDNPQNSAFSGNMITPEVGGVHAGDQNAWAGNQFVGVLTLTGVSRDAYGGNVFTQNITTTGNDLAFAGNIMEGSVTLGVGSGDIALIGNYVSGAILNSGTDNIYITPATTDPLNTQA